MENLNENKSNDHIELITNLDDDHNINFYHNEIVDVYDLEKKISSEAIIISIRGDLYVIKDSHTNEEEVIRDKNKLLIRQCKLYYNN
jgi:hypothetical protein